MHSADFIPRAGWPAQDLGRKPACCPEAFQTCHPMTRTVPREQFCLGSDHTVTYGKGSMAGSALKLRITKEIYSRDTILNLKNEETHPTSNWD